MLTWNCQTKHVADDVVDHDTVVTFAYLVFICNMIFGIELCCLAESACISDRTIE